MPATIRDVAKLAHASPASVSRYFSGSNVVGDELAKRIEEAASKLHYAPNARRINEQGIIVVLVPHLRLGYFSEALREIMEQMSKYKCRVMVLPTTTGDDSYKLFFKELPIKGVIYLDEDIDKDMLKYIQAKNLKVVMLGGTSFDSRCDMVHINDLSAAYKGMKYLLGLNHRDIMILSDYSRSISSGFQRLTGCQQALAEYGIQMDKEKMVEFGYLTYENGYQLTYNAIKRGKWFTAIFAFSDETAVGAICALYDCGYKVPEDVSVLGFDGISISNWMIPKLSTLYQPIDKMVDWTLSTICSRKEISQNMDYILPYQLLERGTCKMREVDG